MNRAQYLSAIRAIGPGLTARFTDGEFRVSIDPAAIRAAYPALTYREAIERNESLAAYETDGDSALATAKALRDSWLREVAEIDSDFGRAAKAELSFPPATVEPTDAAAREAAEEMGFSVETVSESPVMIGKAETVPAPVRRDNVEYHAGRTARREGKALADCPYLAGGERAARWNLGWNDADASERDAEALRNADKPGREYIDMTPTWADMESTFRLLIENGNAEGRRTAWAEIGKALRLADERNVFAGRIAKAGKIAREVRGGLSPDGGAYAAIVSILDTLDAA